MKTNLKGLGEACQKFRLSIGLMQKDVANELGYAPVTISSFETGRTNSAIIYQWYLDRGFKYDEWH